MNNTPIKELLNFSILNVDKPTGPTSFQVSQLIREWFNLNKTSHFGTLDPMVSGVLPVALGRACRLSSVFMQRNKTYVGIMRVHKEISDKELNEVVKKFIGKITQLPPVRSSVKRAERIREVISFNILERNDMDILFETEVEAGTYIRKLCDDMGKLIGGAHMLELRRTKASIFNESESYTLYDIQNALNALKKGNETLIRKMLIPAKEAIVNIMPKVQLKDFAVKKILTGKPLMANDLTEKEPEEDIYAVFHKTQFVAVMKKAKSGDIISRPEFVFN
ncbi:MAG: RNA-guided pseudouridylation complex pseudouridine synthase subunit Cbf5 [Nanoarchaeota archaeon]